MLSLQPSVDNPNHLSVLGGHFLCHFNYVVKRFRWPMASLDVGPFWVSGVGYLQGFPWLFSMLTAAAGLFILEPSSSFLHAAFFPKAKAFVKLWSWSFEFQLGFFSTTEPFLLFRKDP